MELRRARGLPCGIFFLAVGVLIMLGAAVQQGWRVFGSLCLGTCGAVIGGVMLADSFTPFRVHIGSGGLTLRLKGIDRLVWWHEVAALVLDFPMPKLAHKAATPPPRLLLIPSESAGTDLLPTEENPLDHRPCVALFDFNEVKDTPDQVAEALKRLAGDRFTDIRETLGSRFAAPDFTMVLRGYDPEKADALVRAGQQALASGKGLPRITARVEIDGASVPVTMRGYDREQVDAFLRELSAALAILPSDEAG